MVYTVCGDPNGTVDVQYFKEIAVEMYRHT